MSGDRIRYEEIVQAAMLGVVREVLVEVAGQGLPGDHYFYIDFDTGHPGVRIPEHLAKRYPGEMRIVLQHQYWDLEVRDDSFEVRLSFSGEPERLLIPFAAITSFLDPSVPFGLQWKEQAGEEAVAQPDKSSAQGIPGMEPGGDEPQPREQEAANVIELDVFRKK